MDELDAGQRVELDLMREEYQRRYGIAIEYIKNQVGSGEMYQNAVARAVVSAAGAWFECIDQPMEFSGAAGKAPNHRFISDSEATALVRRLYELSRRATQVDKRHFALLLLYARAGVVDRKGVYLIQRGRVGGEGQIAPIAVGEYRPETLPLLFRCRFDTGTCEEGLPFARGVIFGLTGIGERVLVVEIAHEGSDVRDLGAMPAGVRGH